MTENKIARINSVDAYVEYAADYKNGFICYQVDKYGNRKSEELFYSYIRPDKLTWIEPKDQAKEEREKAIKLNKKNKENKSVKRENQIRKRIMPENLYDALIAWTEQNTQKEYFEALGIKGIQGLGPWAKNKEVPEEYRAATRAFLKGKEIIELDPYDTAQKLDAYLKDKGYKITQFNIANSLGPELIKNLRGHYQISPKMEKRLIKIIEEDQTEDLWTQEKLASELKDFTERHDISAVKLSKATSLSYNTVYNAIKGRPLNRDTRVELENYLKSWRY